MDELTEDDLNTLVEALEAWEHKDAAGEIMADIFAMAMMGRGDPASPRMLEALAEQERAQLKRERMKANRKERSVILRAKLLQIRNGRRVVAVQRGLDGSTKA